MNDDGSTPKPPHPLDAITARHRQLGPGGYIWMINIDEVEGEAIDILFGHRIRRANADEVDDLRILLAHFQARLRWRNPWETRTEEIAPPAAGQPSSFRSEAIDPLRYHVLEYTTVTNVYAHSLITSSVLASGPRLVDGYAVTRAGFFPDGSGACVPSGVGSSRNLDVMLERYPFFGKDDRFHRFTVANAEDTARVYQDIGSAAQDVVREIDRIVSAMNAMSALSHEEMRVLGYFTIIESLLTHKPDPEDKHQSLIRQITSKMALLLNRFRRPVSYAAHLGKIYPSPETLWRALYQVRSSIAHGDVPSFSGGASMLRDTQTVERLLVDVVRSLARQFLVEPQLMRDLKEC